MKTKNNTWETVDDQVRRNILRGSAVIFGLVLINLPVEAMIFRTQFSNRGMDWKMEVLSVNQSTETTKTNATFDQNAAGILKQFRTATDAFVCEPEQDKENRLEAWMTNESYFNSAVYFDTAETDETLSLEDWMISNPLFNNLLVEESLESDKPLEIEPWMLLDENFNSVESLTNQEPALKIESWMLNNEIFNRTKIQQDISGTETAEIKIRKIDDQFSKF